ncbi:MAG: hypothetical protein ACRBN8_23140 [Nannocystales bacterium]
MSDAGPYDNLQTCTPENGSLKQEELSTFDGCERLDGSLVLQDGFPDRTNLRSIVVITGNFGAGGYVGEPLTLEGLDSLEIVEDGFGFFEDNLGDFAGVPKLRSVGSFGAELVPHLEDLRGLESLREVHGLFRVAYNPELRSLAGLEGLEHIHGDLTIRGNPLLPPEEIEALLDRLTVDGEIKL